MWRGFVWRWGYSKFQNFQIPSDDGIIFSLFFPTGICHIFALFQVGRGCLGTELSSKNGRRGDGRREQGLEERNINKPPKSNFRFMKFLNTNHPGFRLVIAGLSCWECRMFFVGSGAGRQSQLAWLGLTPKNQTAVPDQWPDQSWQWPGG